MPESNVGLWTSRFCGLPLGHVRLAQNGRASFNFAERGLESRKFLELSELRNQTSNNWSLSVDRADHRRRYSHRQGLFKTNTQVTFSGTLALLHHQLVGWLLRLLLSLPLRLRGLFLSDRATGTHTWARARSETKSVWRSNKRWTRWDKHKTPRPVSRLSRQNIKAPSTSRIPRLFNQKNHCGSLQAAFKYSRTVWEQKIWQKNILY